MEVATWVDLAVVNAVAPVVALVVAQSAKVTPEVLGFLAKAMAAEAEALAP
jgi:hypothetical protein